jgi:hypothetical protein
MSIMGREHYSKIWCQVCGSIQDLVLDEMPANDRNDHAAIDLMCGKCRLVIATAHALPPEMDLQ